MRTGCLIVDGCQRLHENSAELLLLMHSAEVIAPQARLCFERELLGDGVVQVPLLAIDKCRKPIILACVDSPAVKMEIVVRFRRTRKGTVESHNVIIVLLRPEAAHKSSFARLFLRGYVKNQAPYFTQEFASYVIEFVVLAVESVRIDIDHLYELPQAAGRDID